jgi:hypothetical protein
MATSKKAIIVKQPVVETGVARLSAKEFAVNPKTGRVLISQDKISSLVQSKLDKVKGANASSVEVTVSVGVKF